MQIALTKKLAQVMGVKLPLANDNVDPLFSWTANWTNTFSRRKEDMVVMVNNATRFTVAIYGIKRNQFKNIATKMAAAIRNTLLAMNLNPEMVDEYLMQSSDIFYCSNKDRKMTAWVNRSGLDAASIIGRAVNESERMYENTIQYNDSLGHKVSRLNVNYSNDGMDSYVPAEKMIKALIDLTGKPAYKYRAFELLVTLDLEVYKATRRLMVPADMELKSLHKLLQYVFNWKNCHLHEFSILNNNRELDIRIVMQKADPSYDDDVVLEEGQKLSDYFPKNKYMLYTYDMGDNWEHLIELVKEADEHGDESPYLLEAIGQAPPEDVGGVGGFIEFYKIMLDPNHPEYNETNEWVRYWSLELREWETIPKVIRYY